MPSSDLLTKYLHKHAQRFQTALDKVLGSRKPVASRAADADAVHDARVASRRLNTPLRLLGGLAPKSELRPIRRSLRRGRRSLRKLRELDVLKEMLQAPGGPLAADARNRLVELLGRKRERTLAKARRQCSRTRLIHLARDIDKLCQEFPEEAGEKVPSRARDRLATGTQGLTLTPDELRGADLHPLRIQLKRARYACEFAAYLAAVDVDELLQAASQMQDRLGRWHDHVVAARRVGRIASRRKNLRDAHWSAELMDYAAWSLRQAEQVRAEIATAWPGMLDAMRRAMAQLAEQSPTQPMIAAGAASPTHE